MHTSIFFPRLRCNEYNIQSLLSTHLKHLTDKNETTTRIFIIHKAKLN